MDEKLKYYMSSDLYTPIMNIILNKNMDAYSEIGGYLIDKGYIPETYGEKSKYLYDIYKNGSALQKVFSKKDINVFLRMSAITFLTSDLDEKVLTSLFGKPIKHSEFGEGFDRKRKYSYISYFTEMDGYKFHFGIDHRGTNIEVDKYISYDNLILCIQKLIDKYLKLK